ncbi:MAG TPA: 3-deoxy-8-phosphooctulonate synthase, partial [Bacteroidales bacterium]|nr:3-deoxy-8-phosphooctulonate synthase [Bacteroidales bacterium]
MNIPNIKYLDSGNFLLIAGPCVVENREVTFTTASFLTELAEKYSVPFIFKSSYRKANRSKSDSFTGIGDIPALEILAEVRKEFSVPVITDIHNPHEASIAAKYV